MADTQEARHVRIPTNGIELAADVRGADSDPVVIFLHGGGQTRHSWNATAEIVARNGWRSVNVDLRGHGDSDWAPDGRYHHFAFRDDIVGLAEQFDRPVLVGASLGGMCSLQAIGKEGPGLARALILVDITHRINPEGGRRIGSFMNSGAQGFATLEDAADAIAAYNPHRPRPSNLEGLKKNLRFRDGRWHWHYDPKFLTAIEIPREMESTSKSPAGDAARKVGEFGVPTLLVRGKLSDIVDPEHVSELLELIPHAESIDVSNAGHMVVGDSNDVFNESIIRFLTLHRDG